MGSISHLVPTPHIIPWVEVSSTFFDRVSTLRAHLPLDRVRSALAQPLLPGGDLPRVIAGLEPLTCAPARCAYFGPSRAHSRISGVVRCFERSIQSTSLHERVAGVVTASTRRRGGAGVELTLAMLRHRCGVADRGRRSTPPAGTRTCSTRRARRGVHGVRVRRGQAVPPATRWPTGQRRRRPHSTGPCRRRASSRPAGPFGGCIRGTDELLPARPAAAGSNPELAPT